MENGTLYEEALSQAMVKNLTQLPTHPTRRFYLEEDNDVVYIIDSETMLDVKSFDSRETPTVTILNELDKLNKETLNEQT